MTFDIYYAPEAIEDIRSLRSYDQKKILETIKTHLETEPEKLSRSRIKKMVQPFWSQYRLRVGDFRVYFDVDNEKKAVNVLRILEKGREETPREEKP